MLIEPPDGALFASAQCGSVAGGSAASYQRCINKQGNQVAQVAAVTVRAAIFSCEKQTELRGGGQHDAYDNNGSSRGHRITNTLFSFATGKRVCVHTQEMQLEEA